MKYSYTPFLAIFLIFIIIGFSYYKQYESSYEGMTNMDPIEHPIIQRGGRKVRRKINTKEPLKIGKFDMGGAFKKMGGSFKKIGGEFKKVGGFFKKIFDFFKKIGQAFRAIGTNIKCGFDKIVTLPDCMKWYMLEILGKILYFPITFMLWVFTRAGYPELKQGEKFVWSNMEKIDKMIHSNMGFHIIHFPDDVVNKCYKCKGLVPFPKF
jgi:hypothetical protein